MAQSPTNASVDFTLRVVASRRTASRFAFAVQAIEPGETLYVRLEDVHPAYSASFRLRLTTWTKFVINRLVQELTDRTTEALRRNGA